MLLYFVLCLQAIKVESASVKILQCVSCRLMTMWVKHLELFIIILTVARRTKRLKLHSFQNTDQPFQLQTI